MEIDAGDLTQFFADLAPELDERRRRLLCGATARLLGHGGIAAVSRAAGVSRNTVAAGAAEIGTADLSGQRIRREGGGRKSAAEREPALLPALQKLLARHGQHPGGPLEWTLLSAYEASRALAEQGLAVSPSSVAQLMRTLGYLASGRARSANPRKRADLDAQFACLSAAAAAFSADGQPAICVRASRGELAGDENSRAEGAGEEAGSWVRVGPDLSVVGFTVEAIQRWWADVSPRSFPAATRLLICAETFGAGDELRDAWQYHLTRLAHATGLELTVQAIPAGSWRWREREEQYSYCVTLQPAAGRSTRCEVSIDLVNGSAARGRRRAGMDGRQPGASRPGAAVTPGISPHRGGCACRFTARAGRPAQPAADRAGPRDAGLRTGDPAKHATMGVGQVATGDQAAARVRLPGQPAGTPGHEDAAADTRNAPARHAGHTSGPHGLPATTEPRRPKIAEVVAHNIARDISTRRLRPAARLPSETVALTRFNVSRSSLREALRLLELLGVISIKTGAGGGPVVSQVTSADFGTTTTFYYHLIGVTIRELLEARCILEPALVRLAVEVSDPVAKGKLRSSMNNWGGDDALRPAWLAPGDRSRTAGFHRALIETGNAVLDLFSHSLQDVWTARQYMEPYPWQAAPHHDNDHWVIAQAILGNDAATAEGLMRTHMEYLYDFASAHWSGLMDEVIDWH